MNFSDISPFLSGGGAKESYSVRFESCQEGQVTQKIESPQNGAEAGRHFKVISVLQIQSHVAEEDRVT